VNENDARSKQSSSSEATTPFGGPLGPTAPAGRLEVALGGEPAARQKAEVQALLRSRLAGAMLLGLCVAVVTGLILVPLLIAGRLWDNLICFSVLLLTAAANTVLLRSRWRLSLRLLRTIELVDVALLAGVISWHTGNLLLGTKLPALFAAMGEGQGQIDAGAVRWTFTIKGDWPIIFLASYPCLLWFALITGYGFTIPNTWGRCALVVGAITLLPIALAILVCVRNELMSWDMKTSYLFQTISWMAFAAVIAGFGSHRVEILRREAFAARQLGQYQLKRPLGAGGMGEVYLAEHVLLKRPCAVKLIRPERAGDPQHLRRFEREVQAMATLTSWNTVEVFDYGHTADGTFYYVMEYLPGLNLEQMVLRHGPLPAGRVVHLLRQVCAALHEAHGIGLIHRDIKPGNIIACERGRLPDIAKLLDFGLVLLPSLGKGEDRLTQVGSIAGTPAYMSPEQAAGAEDLDERTDIYSLGAVAYFLLTGQPPFVRKTGLQVLAAHLHEPVQPLTDLRPDVPADVQEVVLECLHKDPARRFADADRLERALGRCQCASQWSREEASAWWREYGPESGPVTRQERP
jgi:serine/threonine-protein kinase